MDAAAFTEKPRGNHAGIVEDNQFVSSEEVGKQREVRILELAAGAFDDEQARGVATIQRPLGDQAGRKVVVEVVYAHGAQL